MDRDNPNKDRPDWDRCAQDRPLTEQSRGSGMIFAIVAIALVLAIGFFYLAHEKLDGNENDGQAQPLNLDDDARKLSNAAREAVNDLRRDK